MPNLPMAGISRAVESLKKSNGGHRKVNCFTLDLFDDGVWVLNHYSEPIYTVMGGKGIMHNPAEELSMSDRNAINSLSMVLLGRKEILNKEELKREARKDD